LHLPLIHVDLHISYELGVDSSLSDNFGRSVVGGLSVITTFLTISVVGGPQFFLFIALIGSLYWNSEQIPIIITAVLKASLNSFQSALWQHDIWLHNYTHEQIYGQTSRDLRRLGMSPVVSYIVYQPNLILFRFGLAITVVFNLRRNDIWSNDPACFWGVLEVPA
jgi:hypothetical protein